MDLVYFAAGLAVGLLLGRRRLHRSGHEADEAARPDLEAEARAAHDARMEAILRGAYIPSPGERREADAWAAGRNGRETGS